MDLNNMYVVKRDGKIEEMMFDKILNRVKNIGKEFKLNLNYSGIVIKIVEQLYNNIPTSKIDILTAEYCISMSSLHYDYSCLASCILISNHHKNIKEILKTDKIDKTDKTDNLSFSKSMEMLYNNNDDFGNHTPLISEAFWNMVNNNKKIYDEMIDINRDYLLDYFGFKTLERAYLMKIKNKIIEIPQHLWLRVSITIHGLNFEKVKESYDLMSNKYFTHATPTLFNAGTTKGNLSSCFLLSNEDDSIEGIFNTLKDCAHISKYSGGIGVHIHNIRANGSFIKSTNGTSNGIVPMLRVFNNTARYINQGSKRNGSFAIYLEPWHADVEDFLNMKNNHGDEEMKGRDLFYALWIPDLFMKKVEKNENWCLFCPNKCPGLADVYGEKFDILYKEYENKGLANKIIKARDLWFKILDAQMETGTPYLLYKDACNRKSNQQNIGTIKSSNLCTEIIEYSDSKETAVCNLASIGLPSFVNKETKQFDYEKLHNVSKILTKNLNNIIDINYYPTEKTKLSNFRHRPIGIGVQGLADTFILMDIPFESNQAKIINKNIFETIYHGALEKSNELSKNYGPYETFLGSPASQGLLQFDLWNVPQNNERYDWDTLKLSIKKFGLFNSLLIAPMPTASTSQILGFNECFEPFTSNIYSRGTLAGEFMVVNKYLQKELINIGQWNEKIKNNIIANNGSIQQLDFLPKCILDKYKVVWEIPMKHIIDMATDRGIYICQSQSMNLWVEEPNYKSLTSMHFYSFNKGLKTGIYYLRRKTKTKTQKFTIEPENYDNNNDEICDFCSA
jgi:ribonucleoside-diphosphate reductase alpha chain